MDWSALGLHGHAWADIGRLALHFTMLSAMAIGGVLATASDMHRLLVIELGWITDSAFTSSVALAQAAPGPNVLFVPLLGWNIAGLAGMAAALAGIMIPSSLLAFAVGRYHRKRPGSGVIRSLTSGLAPLTLGLLLSTGWVLMTPTRQDWRALLLVLLTVGALLRFKISPMWLIALGAAAGMAGWV